MFSTFIKHRIYKHANNYHLNCHFIEPEIEADDAWFIEKWPTPWKFCRSIYDHLAPSLSTLFCMLDFHETRSFPGNMSLAPLHFWWSRLPARLVHRLNRLKLRSNPLCFLVSPNPILDVARALLFNIYICLCGVILWHCYNIRWNFHNLKVYWENDLSRWPWKWKDGKENSKAVY